jgi:uncharacterized phage protein (TIGR01671 family)
MREILFRGKRKDNGEWVYGDLAHLSYEIITIQDDMVELETVGQYTGLEDKNGVKIFEGDILRFGSIKNPLLRIVVFYQGGFTGIYPEDWKIFLAGAQDTLVYNTQAKFWGSEYTAIGPPGVIGNIRDTPELLNGK